jgi:prolyl-tRNA editing enzyme YbaK/EbsC (Cys-tRNA(Pro) deacylase)
VSDDGPLHPSAQRVQEALVREGAVGRVREFRASTKTSQDAATALGCDLAAIASCLVFIADEAPIVVIKSGVHRVDLDHLARQLGSTEVRRANADEVRATTGQPIGGVAPVNWPTTPRVLIDASLEPLAEVWAAAGTPNAVFPTTYAELLRLTGAVPVTVVAAT